MYVELDSPCLSLHHSTSSCTPHTRTLCTLPVTVHTATPSTRVDSPVLSTMSPELPGKPIIIQRSPPGRITALCPTWSSLIEAHKACGVGISKCASCTLSDLYLAAKKWVGVVKMNGLTAEQQSKLVASVGREEATRWIDLLKAGRTPQGPELKCPELYPLYVNIVHPPLQEVIAQQRLYEDEVARLEEEGRRQKEELDAMVDGYVLGVVGRTRYNLLQWVPAQFRDNRGWQEEGVLSVEMVKHHLRQNMVVELLSPKVNGVAAEWIATLCYPMDEDEKELSKSKQWVRNRKKQNAGRDEDDAKRRQQQDEARLPKPIRLAMEAYEGHRLALKQQRAARQLV